MMILFYGFGKGWDIEGKEFIRKKNNIYRDIKV